MNCALLKLLDGLKGTQMIANEEASGLLEQAIITLEMIYNFGDDLLTKDELLFKAIKKVVKAQEIIDGNS